MTRNGLGILSAVRISVIYSLVSVNAADSIEYEEITTLLSDSQEKIVDKHAYTGMGPLAGHQR